MAERSAEHIFNSSAFELHLSLEVIDQLQAAASEPDQADLGPAHKLNMLDAVVDCPAHRIVVYLQTEKNRKIRFAGARFLAKLLQEWLEADLIIK